MSALLMTPAVACTLPADWLTMTTGSQEGVQAAISIDREKIVVGEPFTVDLAMCVTKTALDRVTVDATMPLHRHGMNYKPRMTNLGGGRYRATPFVFHMPGLWRVIVKTYRKGQPSYLQRDFQVQ